MTQVVVWVETGTVAAVMWCLIWPFFDGPSSSTLAPMYPL